MSPLKICQVNPGCGIEIPPKNWGAIEKIVWEFSENFIKLGHNVDIKWAANIKVGDYDFVHVHVANLALELAEKNIPYIFHFHDHHAFLYGRQSKVYLENLQAIDKSIFSLVPAKYLVDYFDSNKAVYFPHGVNTDIYVPGEVNTEHKALMVANNGYIENQGHDRKGFIEGIKACSKANLPLTIAGPKNNKNFIENNPWVKDYNVTWLFDLDESDLVKLYHKHSLFLHPSELEAGHPNLTILEAMSCSLPVVGCMEEDLDGLVRVKKSVDNVYQGIREVIHNYEKYQSAALNTASKYSWYSRSKNLEKLLNGKNMKDVLTREYANTVKTEKYSQISPVSITPYFSFTDGAKCELVGRSTLPYLVEFIDSNTNSTVWSDTISSGEWSKVFTDYYIPWRIKITDTVTNKIVYDYSFNCKDKTVQINLESSSLGDTLAWIPYIEEFRKVHNCKVVCSTYKNSLFKKSYPNIEFIDPGQKIDDPYATFRVGWFFDENHKHDSRLHPRPFKNQPLQKTACDILGLSYIEKLPELSLGTYKDTTLSSKYFTFSIQSTAQSRYWNNNQGWKILLDLLQKEGYEGVCIDQHSSFGTVDYMNHMPPNCISRVGLGLEETAGIIKNSLFHIGISSGLSWLAWALNHNIVLISGTTSPYFEFKNKTVRIYNDSVCNGCFNDLEHKFDPSNWTWCPRLAGTEREFECTKTITPEQVFAEIKNKLL